MREGGRGGLLAVFSCGFSNYNRYSVGFLTTRLHLWIPTSIHVQNHIQYMYMYTSNYTCTCIHVHATEWTLVCIASVVYNIQCSYTYLTKVNVLHRIIAENEMIENNCLIFSLTLPLSLSPRLSLRAPGVHSTGGRV